MSSAALPRQMPQASCFALSHRQGWVTEPRTRSRRLGRFLLSAKLSGTLRGVSASLAASAFFGLIFLLSGWVVVAAEYIFAWRVALTLACYLVVLAFPGGRKALQEYWIILRRTRWGGLLLVLLALMVGIQLWLFIWAPANRQALNASLGFLLLPITLVLGGRFIFKSHISRLQWISVLLAATAVLMKLAFTPTFSWVTGFIAVIYPIYFMLRRHTGLDHPAGFGVELAILTPLAIPLLVLSPTPSDVAQQLLVWSIAAGGALAMIAYLSASRWLSLPLFGMLSYVEPLLLVLIALVLGERLESMDVWVYALLAVALLVLAAEALLSLRASNKKTPA